MSDKERKYTDFANIETERNFLTSEEYPEGPYGSPYGKNSRVENKSTPWQKGQQYYSGYIFENRNLHEDLPRQYPGAHPPHDEKSKATEKPYDHTQNENRLR